MTIMNFDDALALAPRVLPRQNRSILRRRRILDAALDLLADHPIETITTGQIARHAGVPITSVYGYFPNKMAIIAELVREGMKNADVRVEDILPDDFNDESRLELIDKLIDLDVDRFASSPFRRRLLGAIRGNKELSGLSRQADDRMTATFTDFYMRIEPDQSSVTARAVAQTIVSTFRALQEGVIECTDPALLPALVAEWRKIMRAYLETPRDLAGAHSAPRAFAHAESIPSLLT